MRLAEERKAFIEENGIKLSDKQLEGIAGGAGHTNTDPQGCPETFLGIGFHDWVLTGRTGPGEFFGDIWPDYEKRCKGGSCEREGQARAIGVGKHLPEHAHVRGVDGAR